MATTETEAGGPSTCPKCGQPAGFPGCRDARDGWYCRQYGLQYDYSRMQHTTPDPVLAKIANDPQVKAAALEEQLAQRTFEERSAEWEAALGELAGIRLKAFSDTGRFDASDGGWHPSAMVGKLGRQERKLTGQIEDLARRRDYAAGELGRAKTAANRAYDQAAMANGKSVMPGKYAAPPGRNIVPL